MAAKKWLAGEPRFYRDITQDPNTGEFSISEVNYLRDLPFRSVVSISHELRKVKDKDGKFWSEVVYKNEKGQDIKGWMLDGFLEDLVESVSFTGNVVPIPEIYSSPDPTDPVQFILWDSPNVIKTNMCGEFCVAFIGGDDIETFLRKWERDDSVFYPWAVKGSSNKPLDERHINRMLEVYGYPNKLTKFRDGLTDPGIGFAPSPGRIKKMLETCYLVAHVRLDSGGKLVNKAANEGFGHWVVLDKITPYGVNRGRVEIYNPYQNRREEHSFADFIRACAPGYSGLWVPRTRPSRGTADVIDF